MTQSLSKDITFFQKTVDNAYSKWDKNKKWDKKEFFNHLTFQEKLAVSLAGLNYEVQNGGFEQWIQNVYAAIHLNFLLETFKINGCLGNLKKMYDILCLVDFEIRRKNLLEENRECATDAEYDEVWEKLDIYDNQYYAINNEKLLYEINTLIQNI